MSVATLLIQPSLVEKLLSLSGEQLNQQLDEQLLGEDLLELIRRIVTNTEKSQAVLGAFKNGIETFGQNFIDNASDFDGGLQQFNLLMTPLIEQIRSFGETDQLNDFAGAVEFIAEKFIALGDFVTDLDINDIRSFVNQILTILTTKFGFSLENIVAQVWLMFDTIINELKTMPGDIDAEERELRLTTASLLGKVKRQLQAQVDLPALSSDDISAAIMKVFRDQGVDRWIEDANQIAEAVKTTFLAAGSIGELINVTGGASVGAAARKAESGDTYCWYASWLLATRKRIFFWKFEQIQNFFILNPSDEVWITADKTQVVWRTVFGDDVCLHEGTDVQWYQAPMFSSETGPEYVLFPHIPHDSMEILAQLSYALTEFGKGIWNSVDAGEKGDRATAITHAIWNAFNTGFSALGGSPFTSYLTAAGGWGQGHQGWQSALFPVIGTTLPSLEGRHTEADNAKFAFWAILFAGDVLERAGHHLLLGTVRDLLLSTLTLINNIDQAQGNDASHPINKEYTDTWAAFGGQVATIIFLKTMYKKEDYKHPFSGFLWSFAGALAGLCGGLTGTLFGSALAGFKISPKSFFTDIALESAKGFGLFYLNAYSWVEGDTDGGKFNGTGTEFAGYPAKSNSPYKLPFAAGDTKPCVQGNQGMWSHFAASNQIYAVDFGFDQAELIVAARSGTVVDFHDEVDDDTQAVNVPPGKDWNYIVIRHDNDTEPADVRLQHDKYHDGNAYVTYGIYGHGRKNGVREVFAARDPSVAVADIRGTQIVQGEAIMKAGNTGISFHNHLHFQVQTKSEVYDPALPGPDSIPLATISSDTIPFVFQDVADNGVVKSLTFYTSTNGTT